MADADSVLSVLVVAVEWVLAVAVTGLSVAAAASPAAVVVEEQLDIEPLAALFAAVADVAVAAELVLAFELVGFFLSSYQYCELAAAVVA